MAQIDMPLGQYDSLSSDIFLMDPGTRTLYIRASLLSDKRCPCLSVPATTLSLPVSYSAFCFFSDDGVAVGVPSALHGCSFIRSFIQRWVAGVSSALFCCVGPPAPVAVARVAQVRLRLWFVGAGWVVGDYEQLD